MGKAKEKLREKSGERQMDKLTKEMHEMFGANLEKSVSI